MGETQELRFQVAEVWKGPYDQQVGYGCAAVVQDPTGLSIYRSLKSGNTGHPLSDTTWWFCIIDLSSIKSESDRIAALNAAIAEAEALRVAAEQQRVLAEQQREQQAAADHQQYTDDHAQHGADHQQYTEDHAQQQSDHQQYGLDHQQYVSDHQQYGLDHQAELRRQENETLREQAETQRDLNEQNRVAAEQDRSAGYSADHALSQELNSHPMRINTTTLTWEVWDAENNTYVDTGIFAMSTPYATFEVNQTTGQLECTTDAYYNGPAFSLNQDNGNIQITL